MNDMQKIWSSNFAETLLKQKNAVDGSRGGNNNFITESQRAIVEVDGVDVFSASWVIKQMQALQDLYGYNKARLTASIVISLISGVLAIIAIVLAIWL